ncbi:DNA-binding response regulator [Vallitalea longa]|uniref:Stage 0 sporulation protein A homolog n=1 Tax=Vallitalea longa TaxID=2936439 RepID=A0A9W5YCV8_9FIRM|nr:response regulator transcription factor [Vallitalea longa]GKX29574.1 DNA-binding response regulator [Vallitalea longa]
MKQILLLEDDESLNRGISFKLNKEGYEVLSCYGISEGKKLFYNNNIDLVICDIGLEDGSGLDFCRDIRKSSNVRLVFLTALDEEIDIVMGYEAGADDYITKPFSLAVLISKVNAIFKRLEGDVSEKLESGNICFIKNEMKVIIDGNEKILSKNELKLLSILMEHPKQILSKKQLLECLWDIDGDYVDENTVAVNIRRLREKIETVPSKPKCIKNVRGIGYLWDMECRKNDR